MYEGPLQSFAPWLWHCKWFPFNSSWRHKRQRHNRSKLVWVEEKYTFYWCIDFEKFSSSCKTYWNPLIHVYLLLRLKTHMWWMWMMREQSPRWRGNRYSGTFWHRNAKSKFQGRPEVIRSSRGWYVLLVLPAFDLLADLVFTEFAVLRSLDLVVDSDQLLLECIFARCIQHLHWHRRRVRTPNTPQTPV